MCTRHTAFTFNGELGSIHIYVVRHTSHSLTLLDVMHRTSIHQNLYI